MVVSAERLRIALLFLLLVSSAALADPRRALTDIQLGLEQDPGALKLTSVGDRTIVALLPAENDPKGATWHGIDPGMDAQTTRVIWTSRLACPLLPEHELQVAGGPSGSLVLCRTDHDVFALSPQDGSVRWRFHDDRKLERIGHAGQRVAVNLADTLLIVLDLQTGKVLRRFGLGGAPLGTVVNSAAGPLALVVTLRDSTEEGHTHALLAQSLAEPASTTDARPEPLQPLWQTPFGAATYALFPSQNAVTGSPAPMTIDAHDTATGQTLWTEPAQFLPTLEPVPGGLAVGGVRPDGVRWIGLMETRTRVLRWRRPWTLGALQGVGEDNGHLLWLGERGWLVTRLADGVQEAAGQAPEDHDIAAIQAADHVLTLALWHQKTGLIWQQIPLTGTELPQPLPPQVPPNWLTPDRQLLWVDLRHGGRDKQTLLPGDGPLYGHETTFERAAAGWQFKLLTRRGNASMEPQQVKMPQDALQHAHRLVVDLAHIPPGQATMLVVSRDVWKALRDSGRTELALDDAPPVAFHTAGDSAVRMQTREGKTLHWTDLDVKVVTNDDGSARLWLMPLAGPGLEDLALVVRAELPKQTWALTVAQPVVQQPVQTPQQPGKKARKKK